MSDETAVANDAVRTKFQRGERRLIHRSLIKNAPYNPRKISPSNSARLRESIKTHGLVGSLVWNELTGNIVGGHQRLEKVDELEKAKKGDYYIEVDVVQLSDLKEKSLNIILNNPSVAGEWDLSLLEGVLEDFKVNDVSFEEAGWSDKDVSILFPASFMMDTEVEQAEAEFPILAEIDDIKRSSAEYDAQFREDAKNQPFAKQLSSGATSTEDNGVAAKQSTDGMPDVEGMDDETPHDYESEETHGSGESVQPTGNLGDQPRSAPKMKMTADVDPETGEKIWTQEQRDSFGKTRSDHWKTTEDSLAGDVVICLTFQRDEQLTKFIEKVGADPKSRYWNITEINRVFGFDLD